jgi:hypothetical protein
MFGFRQSMILFHLKLQQTRSSSLSFRMPSEPWMERTLTAALLLTSATLLEIGREGSRKIHWHVAASTCAFNIFSVEWMAALQMLACTMMHGYQTLPFLLESIIWQTQALECVTHS